MPSTLKTEWKVIGRSGPTVDGRTIEAEWLVQAAETYDPKLYTAQIWPEHFRWFNMGKIESLLAKENEEGGVDLFAKIIPNDYYLQINASGQKLFSSMELTKDFRKTGKYYLTGSAATDSPASAATSEIRFTALGPEMLFGESVPFESHQFSEIGEEESETPPRWFKKIFNSRENDDMSKEALAAVQVSLDALTENFKKFAVQPPVEKTAEVDQFAAITAEVAALTARFSAFENKGQNQTEGATVSVEEFAALQKSLEALTNEFSAALEENPGTEGGVHTGGEDASAFI